ESEKPEIICIPSSALCRRAQPPASSYATLLTVLIVIIKMGVLTEQQIATGDKCMIANEQSLQLSGECYTTRIFCPPLPPTNEEVECLKELRRLIKEDDEIRDSPVEQTDEFLIAFVRGKRCNTQKAFKALQNYVYVRKVRFNKFFKALSPRNFQYMYDREVYERFSGVLKHTDHEGRVVGVMIASKFNPRVQKGEDVLQSTILAGEQLLHYDIGPRNGLVLVVDAAGFGFRHAREVTMSRIYMFLQTFLTAYPVKYKGFHILNNAYLFDTILTVVKQLIPKKLRDRIHLHGSNLASLHEHISPEILPEHFGGHLKGEDAYDLDYEQTVFDNTDYYEKLASKW
ncbi:Clavesin-1, partial [Orchesella cincta]